MTETHSARGGRPWMRTAIALLVTLSAVGCGDYGDAVTPDTVDPYAVARPDVLLLEWEARGAIPAADVNRDGTVDIFDLIIVAQSYGQDVIVEDPPVRLDSLELKRLSDTTWSYKLTATNTTPVAMEAWFVSRLFDEEGFFLDEDFLYFDIGEHATVTVRDTIRISPARDYFNADGIPIWRDDSDPMDALAFHTF